jgi:hypothetical protein
MHITESATISSSACWNPTVENHHGTLATMAAADAAYDDDLLSDEQSEDDGAADALLEDMRRLNQEVAAQLGVIGDKSETANVVAGQMHTRLTSSVLDMINDVASGKAMAEASAAEEAPEPEQAANTACMLSLSEPLALSPAPPPPRAKTSGSGRFRPQPTESGAAERQSAVSAVSRLASKPLLDDSKLAVPPRRGAAAAAARPGAPRPGGGATAGGRSSCGPSGSASLQS